MMIVDKRNRPKNNIFDSGFTFLEMIAVLLVIGILSAIATPSWLGFINNRRLSIAENQVYQAMRQAQSQAKKEQVSWQASFKEENNRLRWSVHPTNVDSSQANWYDLDENIQLDAETTLPLSDGVRRVEFDYLGSVKPPLERITLSSKSGGASKRCVFVSTILGALRTAKENNKPDEKGNYCY
ncbi:type II secretion system protein [Anabaena sp. FACHB-1237]|uniref:pilus assembly FimT family protein n=1 Tax=Anabaena sp. FACHB-1237 TaxID=2692769 RepID=UPI001680DAA3|nr:type II secretion system protein [Anabaena sp. FACHB-1237]MBD2137185.1 type II secretion system protein [Anabaena sp. FACHB-1237]